MVSHELLVPHNDNEGNDLSYLMPGVKRYLAQNGVPGFTVKPAKGTWTDPDTGQEYPDEGMHHVMADVPDTPEHDALFSNLAEAIAHEGRQQAVYHRKVPVQIGLHAPKQHPDIDLSAGYPEQGAPAPADDFEYTASIFSS